MNKIILASASARRQMLLTQIGMPFTIIESTFEEIADDNEVSPYELVRSFASQKALNVLKDITEDCIIIAADTMVTYLGKVMGKPKDEKDAYQMLKLLQGTKHSVYTGMTVIFKTGDTVEQVDLVDNTNVCMRKLSDDEIYAYIQSGEPFGKAGAYAIQEKASLFIEKIEGDYYTVVGLPLNKLYKILKDHDVDITAFWN